MPDRYSIYTFEESSDSCYIEDDVGDARFVSMYYTEFELVEEKISSEIATVKPVIKAKYSIAIKSTVIDGLERSDLEELKAALEEVL